MMQRMLSTSEATFRWWTCHQLQYNAGLAMAGVLAFIAYAVVGSSFLPAKEEFEITLFTLFVQGIGYLVMMVVANIFDLLGPLIEIYLKPHDPDHFRRTYFNRGFWFSVTLPFTIPLLLVIECLVLFVAH
jgi:hypothetical protein